MAAYTVGFMIHVTCRLSAKNWDQLRNPTLGNRVWATFTFFLHRTRAISTSVCHDIGHISPKFSTALKVSQLLLFAGFDYKTVTTSASVEVRSIAIKVSVYMHVCLSALSARISQKLHV